ncbi:hypothetical protein HDK64DRAFT_327030 [Phyllosticta capitalensis]
MCSRMLLPKRLSSLVGCRVGRPAGGCCGYDRCHMTAIGQLKHFHQAIQLKQSAFGFPGQFSNELFREVGGSSEIFNALVEFANARNSVKLFLQEEELALSQYKGEILADLDEQILQRMKRVSYIQAHMEASVKRLQGLILEGTSNLLDLEIEFDGSIKTIESIEMRHKSLNLVFEADFIDSAAVSARVCNQFCLPNRQVPRDLLQQIESVCWRWCFGFKELPDDMSKAYGYDEEGKSFGLHDHESNVSLRTEKYDKDLKWISFVENGYPTIYREHQRAAAANR